MKKLGTDLADIIPTAQKQEVLTSTAQRGLIKTDGKQTGNSQPVITTQSQATAIRSLIYRAKSVKTVKMETTEVKLPSGRTQRRTRRIVTTNQVQLTPNEQRQLTACLQCAHEDVINANLVRLYFEKRLTGDKNQQAYTLRDYVRRLKGITELEVFEMAEHFIENHDSDFAPKFSSMKAWLRENNIDLNKRC